ncbi:MAG: N-acetylmuramoyl-L-alanine amidase [Oscillospiraceae bacterium]|nr:N-acetylmuramoyl-L-alanine amidase [Oscillospiraceae bacterium]
MPSIFLSPSTQEYNPYITGSGSEEYWMNQIADAMEPYLRANGIRYTRNSPEGSAADAIRQGNRDNPDFYLALHSNASGSGSDAGTTRGIIAFYYPGSVNGQRAAELIAEELRQIYPLPELVVTRSTTALGEVRQPRMPAVLVEIGYHDNVADALWIESHVVNIARSLTEAMTRYFGLPFTDICLQRPGVVATEGSPLRLRAAPSTSAAVLARMPNGAPLTVCGMQEDWYTVLYNGLLGYAAAQYVRT